jgi:mannose-6-phosphate isomerase-like protein (cupin superfamily)
VKKLICIVFLTAATAATSSQIEVFPANSINDIWGKISHNGTAYAAQELARYSTHYITVAYREGNGVPEEHDTESAIFFIKSGQASILIGGKIADPTSPGPGEVRGTQITGGERRNMGPGDVVHLPAGVPYQVFVDRSTPIEYLVVKVKER